MVISEELRIWLYPLGIVSTIAFTLRFLIQWIHSEKVGRSVVTPPFWWLSILGNVTLGVHTFIQAQYPVCLVQALNGVIAGRNLNLMQPLKDQWSLRFVSMQLGLAALLPTMGFILFSPGQWMRVPTHIFQQGSSEISLIWHGIGALGVILFASRFFIQWIQAEQAHKSALTRPFWWLSLVGALLSILYFGAMQDYVNLVGPLFGMIPYARNLMLMDRSHVSS